MPERLACWLKGYLLISLRGREGPFLTACSAEDIFIWDVRTTATDKVIAKIEVAGFKRIRPAVRRTGVRVDIERRCGLPFFIARLWRRTAFVLGALLFLLILQILGSTLWFVEIVGNEKVPGERIYSVAAEYGLAPGVLRSSVSTHDLARTLTIVLPELSWVGIELKGSRAVIEVVEKTLVSKETKPLGHVVAKKAGIIQKIVATTGKAMVKVGDNVREGQILISGAFQVDEAADVTYVSAQGIADAYVSYEGSAVVKNQRMVEQRTGRKAVQSSLVGPSFALIYAGPTESPFLDYEEDWRSLPFLWRNFPSVVEHRRKTYYETVKFMELVPIEAAREEARSEAERVVLALLPPEAQLVNLVYSQEADGAEVAVRAQALIVEPIGEFEMLKED